MTGAAPVVILNPSARGERAAGLVDEVRALIGETERVVTGAPGEARERAAAAARAGASAVVAAGGDGTVHEVVGGIAGTGAALGVLPLGTMNVFALEMGLPTDDLPRCWAIASGGSERRIDLPSANGSPFVQMAGIGFDAQIVAQTTGEFKKQWGPMSYVFNAAQVAARQPPELAVRAGERSESGSFVLVGNGRYYGGPFELFPQGRPDDGLLDVLIFSKLGYLDIVRYLQAIVFGKHPELDDVHYFQADRVTVTSGEVVPFETDGELAGSVPVEFGIEPGAVRVRVA
jgi:YegS/Rv2252/BmrU family lipid kinase